MTRAQITVPNVFRVTFHTKPDKLKRRQFTLEWWGDRPRGQVFFTDPAPYFERWEREDKRVEIAIDPGAESTPDEHMLRIMGETAARAVDDKK